MTKLDQIPKTMDVLAKWAKADAFADTARQHMLSVGGDPDEFLSMLINGLFQQRAITTEMLTRVSTYHPEVQ